MRINLLNFPVQCIRNVFQLWTFHFNGKWQKSHRACSVYWRLSSVCAFFHYLALTGRQVIYGRDCTSIKIRRNWFSFDLVAVRSCLFLLIYLGEARMKLNV